MPRNHRKVEECQCERGENEVLEAIDYLPGRSHIVMHDDIDRSADWKQGKPECKGHQHQPGEPEVGNGKEHERDAAENSVRSPARAPGLSYCDRNSQEKSARESQCHERERVRKRVRECISYRPLQRIRETEISTKYVRDISDILFGKRAIESVRVAPARADRFGNGRILHRGRERIGGRSVNQEKNDSRNERDDYDSVN